MTRNSRLKAHGSWLGMTHNSRLKGNDKSAPTRSWLTAMLLVIGVIASAAGIPGSSAAATTGFGYPVYYAITPGSGPESVAAGDLNNDGALDLATANLPVNGVNTVSVLRNNGNGTFSHWLDYATGSSPQSVATGDFSGDGNLDLAVANAGSSTVSVLLGNGDGTLQPKVDYPTGTGPDSVTSGDFNGDGKLDLAVANQNSNTISVLPGNGDGRFQTKVDYTTGTTPYSVTTADFNGDGKLDLAVANSGNNNVSILLGNGNGTFQTKVDYATGTAPVSVTTGDFNGDGKLDLATGNYTDSKVSVLLGNGDGTFQAKVDYATGSIAYGVATGDFNSDGNLDLAVTDFGASSVSVLLGNGDGTFQPKTDYFTAVSPRLVAAANLHSRGTFDLAVANTGEPGVSVLLNNAPSPLPYGRESTMVYTLTGSNGTTWVPMDTTSPTPLQQRVVPACTCQAILTANSSLWTNTANLNQDIGIEVSGGKYGYYPGTLVAWEESGGSNVYSPNAATVKKKLDVQSGVAYTVTLVWKSNVTTATGQIWASAGKAGGARSPTSLLVEMPGWA